MTQSEIERASRRLDELNQLGVLDAEALKALNRWWQLTRHRNQNKVVNIDDFRKWRQLK